MSDSIRNRNIFERAGELNGYGICYIVTSLIVGAVLYFTVFRGVDWSGSSVYLYKSKNSAELFAPGHEIKVIGIRHGEKMYETLLTNEECANAIDMGEFYRVPCDKRDLNYDKYFKEGDVERNILTEFNSSNTELLDVEQVKEKLLTLQYIRDELAEWENR